MPSDRDDEQTATIWQGFRHAWEYNHRLNRLGSYVRSADGAGDLAGHTAASGTGGDAAHFSEYATRVRADPAKVGFQTGWGEVRVECPRAVTAAFRIKVDELPLEPALVGKDRYTVLINGFDLYAERHADKLVSFDVEVTDPVVYASGTKIRFDILGNLRFDCRTAECQLWPVALEMEQVGRRGRPPERAEPPPPPARKRGIEKRPAIEQAVNWLKRQIARFTDLDTLKQGMLGREEDRLRRRLFRLFGRQFFLRVLKWRIVTPYVLRVPYLVVGGDEDQLAVTQTRVFENSYDWDTETEIQRETLGTQPIVVEGEPPDAYAVNTFGFKQLSLETTLDQTFETSNPIQWGTGMHLLELDAAVREIEATDGRVAAQLDLFYKSWSVAMNQVITLTTWGALRSAGTATLKARLALLQVKNATAEPFELPGEIHWPGGGLNAKDHPRALLERPVTGARGTGERETHKRETRTQEASTQGMPGDE
jgi:hypothetical protein